MNTKSTNTKPASKFKKDPNAVQTVDDRKILRYDTSFGTVVSSFIVQLLDILFVVTCFFWFLKGITQTLQHSNCSLLMNGWPGHSNPECGNWNFFTFAAYIRLVGCCIAATVLFFMSTQAGMAAIGYSDVSHSLKMDKFMNLFHYDGSLANFMISLFFLSLLMHGNAFYADYDNLDDNSMLYISDAFVSGQLLYVLFIFYIALRMIFSYFRIRSNPAFLSVEESGKETKTIYAHTAMTLETQDGISVFNLVLAAATAASVILLHVVSLYAIVTLVRKDPGSDRLYVTYFYYLMLCVNTVKHFAYVLYCFDNLSWKLKIHSWNIGFLILDSSFAYSFINYQSYSANVYLAYSSMCLNLVIAVTVFIGQMYFRKKNEAGTISSLEKWLYSISNDDIILLFTTGSIYFVVYTAVIVLFSKLLEFKDVLETIGYDIVWTKDLVNKPMIQNSLLAFKTNDTSLRWLTVLFMMIDIDTLSILLIVSSSIMFSRKLLPAKTMKQIVVFVILYQSYTTFRADAISDSIFEYADLGYAVTAPKRNVLEDISFASRMAQFALMYFLVMLSFVKGNVAPADTKEEAEFEKGNQGKRRFPKFRPDIMQLASLLLAVLVTYLVVASIMDDWIVMTPKNFNSVIYTNEYPQFKAQKCSIPIRNTVCQRLSDNMNNFVQSMVRYREENLSELEKIRKAYFETPDDKLGFLLPVILSWAYFVAIIAFRPPESTNMILHLVIIINNILNYLSINIVYVIINLYAKSFPGLFMEIVCGEGYDYAVYAIILTLSYSIFSWFSFIAPIEVPEKPIT